MIKLILIRTSNTLRKLLGKFPDQNLTIRLKDKEYIIDTINHIPNCTDSPTSHLCLDIKDGGEGEILR